MGHDHTESIEWLDKWTYRHPKDLSKDDETHKELQLSADERVERARHAEGTYCNTLTT